MLSILLTDLLALHLCLWYSPPGSSSALRFLICCFYGVVPLFLQWPYWPPSHGGCLEQLIQWKKTKWCCVVSPWTGGGGRGAGQLTCVLGPFHLLSSFAMSLSPFLSKYHNVVVTVTITNNEGHPTCGRTKIMILMEPVIHKDTEACFCVFFYYKLLLVKVHMYHKLLTNYH